MQEQHSQENETTAVEAGIADWIFGFSLSDAPAQAVRTARMCIADALGVMLAGSRSDVAALCAKLPRAPGPCAIAGLADKGLPDEGADAAGAAFQNGVACHALDFDDTSYAGIVHGTAVVLPAVLAVAQETGCTGAQFIESYIAGVETEYALGLALTDSLYQRGFWATATLGVLGAAAGAAKLLGLGPDGIAHALRLAANMPLGLRVTHGANGKPYLCGMAARLGVEAARAAAAGIQGQPGTFESSKGYAAALNGGLIDRSAPGSLGRRYALVDPGIAFKLRPICSAAQAAVDATVALRQQHGFGAADVRAVLCRGTGLVYASLPYSMPVEPAQAQFSMQFAVACTLVHGDVQPRHLTAGILQDAQLRQLMARIELVHDTGFMPAAQAASCPEADHVTITLTDGRQLQQAVLAATGMPQNPAPDERMRQKFMDCAAAVIGNAAAARLWEQAHLIEDLPRIRDLVLSGQD